MRENDRSKVNLVSFDLCAQSLQHKKGNIQRPKDRNGHNFTNLGNFLFFLEKCFPKSQYSTPLSYVAKTRSKSK